MGGPEKKNSQAPLDNIIVQMKMLSITQTFSTIRIAGYLIPSLTLRESPGEICFQTETD